MFPGISKRDRVVNKIYKIMKQYILESSVTIKFPNKSRKTYLNYRYEANMY